MGILQGIIFFAGYLAIIFEHQIRVNKTAAALGIGSILWGILFATSGDANGVMDHLALHLSDTSQIVFFLIGAMTIVELIDSHNGFAFITRCLTFTKRSHLLWAVGFSSFFLSSVLDNLTTTIAMVSILRKILPQKQERWIFGSLVVIAANAGGAWTPIGDVTTTMLWMDGQITTLATIKALFIPSFVSLLTACALFHLFFIRGKEKAVEVIAYEKSGSLIFCLGILLLVMVPVLKALFHLPPYMGMLLGVSIMWIVTDRMDAGKEKSLAFALGKIDLSSALFFMGILLAIGALETAGHLGTLMEMMGKVITNDALIATTIGISSALIDNVPLVAGCMGMYPMEVYPVDCSFWQMIAYCSGTGGSMLIIGSAAGVALMGLEEVPFLWFLKKITLLALISFLSGIVTFVLLS